MRRRDRAEATGNVSRRGLFSLGAARLIPDEEGLAALGVAVRNFQDAEAGVERTNFDALRDEAREAWSRGDYGMLSRALAPAAATLVQSVAAGERHAVLDVGAGDGNLTLAAAAAGARVTAVDLSPKLVDAGRARSRDAGAVVRWQVGDAEQLPFADNSFDLVLSNFGAMFSPRPRVASAELVRVARPGGVIAITTWSSSGFMGRLLDLTAQLAPVPRDVARPSRWGRYESAFLWLGSVVDEFEMDNGSLELSFESQEDAWRSLSTSPGPLAAALERAGDERRRDARSTFAGLVDSFAAAPASASPVRVTASYALLRGRKPPSSAAPA